MLKTLYSYVTLNKSNMKKGINDMKESPLEKIKSNKGRFNIY